MEFDVLTIGDLCVDLILAGDGILPEFGQKEKMVDTYRLEMGGSCSIFACQAGKLGLKTGVIGKVGKDEFGTKILNELNNSNVDTSHIMSTDMMKTGITVVINNGSDRAMLTYGGTIDAVGIDEIPRDIFCSTKHFHIGSYFLMKKIQPHYIGLLKLLKSKGVTVSLDTNWDPEEAWDSGIWDILPLVDIFFPNGNEILAITKENTVEKGIERLKKIIPVIAVKEGERGAKIYADGEVSSIPPIKIEKLVDTIGAGDSFDAGFIFGYLSGFDIEVCGKIGCACGGYSTRQHGGVTGQPSCEEISGFIKK